MANPNSRDIRAVAKLLSEPAAAAAAVDGLVDAGCDREEVLRLLARLRHADVASRRATKKLKRLARTLDRASAGIGDLPKWRESPHLGLPDDAAAWLLTCSHDLKLLADAIRLRLAQAAPHSDEARIDRARTRLLEHVIGRTAQAHDREVATLIAAVLRWETYALDVHVRWRTTLAAAAS